MLAAGRAALGASLAFGSLTLSLGHLVAFGVTVASAFLLSRVLRFVLEEDVYPRVPLGRGVPYAISSLLHYVILFGGFVLAIFAMGVDLTRVTILAGAFGVGIGFGLQNVVNNFVSGLIMLFERPMKLGDTVQVADVSGIVERIGIRSSTLRTAEGAEVVVPNASLISERLTNWTLSNSRRRVDLKLGVAYGTDPQKLLELLLSAARSHREVLAYPPPVGALPGLRRELARLRAALLDGRLRRLGRDPQPARARCASPARRRGHRGALPAARAARDGGEGDGAGRAQARGRMPTGRARVDPSAAAWDSPASGYGEAEAGGGAGGDQARPRSWLALGLPGRALLAAWRIQAALPLNHDVGWLLLGARRLLDAGHLSADRFVDVTPPLVVGLYALPVAAARALGVSEITALRIFVIALAAGALGLCQRAVSRLLAGEPRRGSAGWSASESRCWCWSVTTSASAST